MTFKKPLFIVSIVAVVAVLAAPAMANVYASGMTQTGATSFSYILNEAASSVQVQVWQVGGGMVYAQNLGAQAQGTNTWNWASAAGGVIGGEYKIKIVAASAGYAGWTQISTDTTPTSFYVPVGVSVNTIQSSADFGKMFVSNATAGTTAFGRPTSDGIYVLNADSSAAGFTTGGITWTGGSSPWKSTVGPDGKLYVSDLSNDLCYEFSSDLSTATLLIDASNRTTNQWVGGVEVTGTGANRKLYLVDVNYNDTARKGVIEYNLSGTKVATGDTGTQFIGPSYFTYYPYDAVVDSAGDWYVSQYRYEPAQAPVVSKFDGDLPLPINTALWETSKVAPFNGGYCLDVFEPMGWVAYGNYYDGWVHVFNMADGSYVGGFDAGTRMRDVAFDAAGNIVTVDNMTEWMKVWSPGLGANSFTTESWFTVTVVPEPSSLLALLAGLPGLLIFKRRKH